MGCGLLCLCRPLGIFLLEAVLLLMSDKLVVTLEDQQAFLALVVEARGPGKSSCPIIVWINGWLVLVDLTGLLSGILEPNNYDARTKAKQLGKVLKVVIFGICIVFKELLQHLDLIVSEPCSISPLALTNLVGWCLRPGWWVSSRRHDGGERTKHVLDSW